MLILSGNVLEKPGWNDWNLKFFHWNLNSITTRDNTKISLIKIYNSIFNYDLIAISDTRLDRSISNEGIQTEGFSCGIFQSDHPTDTKNPGGVCLYYKENIPIKRRKDFEILQESVVTEISLRRKKVFFIVLYHHPNQANDEFDLFLDRLPPINISVLVRSTQDSRFIRPLRFYSIRRLSKDMRISLSAARNAYYSAELP